MIMEKKKTITNKQLCIWKAAPGCYSTKWAASLAEDSVSEDCAAQ